MKIPILSIVLMLASASAAAADQDAGKNLAARVCAACHGQNGVSVADHIPNLAAQRAGYLAGQLGAFKDASRKSEIMNGIATQLSASEIVNVAAHYAAQVGASGNAKSAFLPNLVKPHVTFPANFKTTFKRYHTVNDAESRAVKIYYANDIAVSAAVAGKTLPDGASIFIEVFSAKVDADKKPLTGADGNFVPDQLRAYTAMVRDASWGADIPEILRNENWNYALFSADQKLRSNVNQAECLACHKPAAKMSYVFTLKELAAVGK